MSSAGAFAQTAPVETPTAQADDEQEAIAPDGVPASDIIVTGTRLSGGLTSPTPVTVQSTADLRAAAPTTLGEALTQLPAFKNSSRSANAGVSAVRNNGANLLNLRGLEPQRTLVLLDGRRVVAGNAIGAPDVNLFPQDLVKRVEIVTGGASAAYGSDAVAGVVNFILDKEYTGLKLRAQAGISGYGDGANQLASATYGASLLGGDVRILASAEYFKQDEITAHNDRSWATQGYAIIVNPNAPPQRLIAPARSSNSSFGGLIVGGPLDGLRFAPDGTLVPFVKGTAVTSTAMIGGDGVPGEYGLVAGLERVNTFLRVAATPASGLEVYLEGGYAKSTASFDVALPSQTAATAFTIFRENAFLSPAVRQRLIDNNVTSFRLSRVDRDFGYSRADSGSTMWRIAGGFDWSAAPGLKVSGYAAHGQNQLVINTIDNIIWRNLFAAADAVVDPTSGRTVCRSTLQGLDPGCQPLNLLGEGAPSRAALDYIHGTSVQDLTLRQTVASLAVSGAPFKLPAGDVQMAVGVEYRREDARQLADGISQSTISATGVRGLPASLAARQGGFFLSNPLPFSGSYNVKELFGELEVPLLDKVPGAQVLSINGAARLVDYSTVGSVAVWKAGAIWEPFTGLRFRATRSRDIRAANVSELFSPPVSTQGSVIYQNVGRAFLGKRLGNIALQPEKADTLTAGIVYRPSFVPGLAFTVDYYDINLKGAIGQLSAQQTVDQCAAGNQVACAQISDQAGLLIIQAPTLNLAGIKTRGIDGDLSYRTSIGASQLGVRLLGSYLDKLETTVPGGAPIDRAGDIGVGGTPRFTANLQLNLSTKDVDLFVQERFIGAGVIDVTAPADFFTNDRVGPVWYTDATARVKVADRFTLSATINNLFDRDPPIVPTIPYGGYRATNFSLYDVLGRYMTIGAEVKF